MPTFRDTGASSFPFDWGAFDAALKERKLALIVRMHIADRSGVSENDLSSLQQIKVDGGDASRYPLFKAVDGGCAAAGAGR